MSSVRSRWSDAEAAAAVAHYGAAGLSEDLALRVYTTRLLGQDPLLVLHGGGNTSVKTRARDVLGDEVEVLAVKGSGWDMGTIEPPGLPLVRLEPLRRARRLTHLSDEDMVSFQRANLLDAAAPNPSVETLLHAFLPHRFVDHTHAAAVLSIVDQPDAERLARDVWGARAAYVPYIMPGFALARAAAEIYEADPRVEALILLRHGIFTFGADAREAYERMIEMVMLAERRLEEGRRPHATARLPGPIASVAEVAPIVRGACALRRRDDTEPGRFVLAFRTGPDIRAYVDGADLAAYAGRGVVTPDHVIRTKRLPLILPAPVEGRLNAFEQAVRGAVERFAADYRAYFAAENARVGLTKHPLDPMPRVVLVPGLGLFGVGKSFGEASVAADLAENTIRVVSDAEAIGRYEPLGTPELFDMEYWSLEQAKLGKAAPKPFAGQVAVVTGAAGAIGRAIAAALRGEGAEVALLDLDPAGAEAAAAAIGGFGLACDVTDRAAVASAFDRVAERFGGLDILVSNAGAAWQGRIGEADDAMLRKSFELNFFAHQGVAQEAVRIMRTQGTGGVLLFNVSKQAVNPGPDFGPYGLPKAATLALVRQYAVDHGGDGIRSNGVNADRIRSGLLTDDMIRARSTARGLSEADYMGGNLLRREVTAADVAAGFVMLAKARSTTGHILTVDGGNIAAALR
jgi:rhamnose utilization protein RhaD (predicted bifunctional aldolase and dehydrogenase)/NAD(P)-dependent dehydrogenase (short-subunit alcohol dehydrogenase family)